MQTFERQTERRARILAPAGGTLEVFESVKHPDEPAETPAIFLVLFIDQANADRPLGTAENLGAALMLCALEVARQLVETDAAGDLARMPITGPTH